MEVLYGWSQNGLTLRLGLTLSPSNRWRGAYMAGTVNSVPLVKVWRKSVYFLSHIWWPYVPQKAQNRTDLHLYFQKFPGSNTPGLPKLPPPQTHSPRRAPIVTIFQGFHGRCWVIKRQRWFNIETDSDRLRSCLPDCVLSTWLVSDGVLSTGLVSDGVLSTGLVSDGVLSTGLVSDGVLSTWLVSDCVLSTGLVSDCVLSTWLVSDCVMSTWLVSDCVLSTGLMSDCVLSTWLVSDCVLSTGLVSDYVMSTWLMSDCVDPRL